MLGVSYDGNELIEFTMPAGTTVCDIGNFTIWCNVAQTFFTHIEIPRTLFVRNYYILMFMTTTYILY